MSYKIGCFIIVCVFFLNACLQNRKNDVMKYVNQSFDVQEYIDTTSLQYVVLESGADCMINRVQQLLVTDSCIFIVNNEPNILYMFTYEGKFLRPIGTQGRGEGEYLKIKNIDVDESKKEITLYDSRLCKAMIYDYSGKFLRSCGNDKHVIGEIAYLNDSLYVLQNYYNEIDISDNPKILIIDREGKIVNTFIPLPQDINKISEVPKSDGFFAKNKDGIYYILYGDDEIYKISRNGHKNVSILSLGIKEYMMPININWEEFMKQSDKFGPLSNLCITDQNVFSVATNFDKKMVQMIGNTTDNIKLIGTPFSNPDSFPGLINPITTYRDYFVGLISAVKASQFKDKFPTLIEDDNPIVVFFKYKLP